MRYLITLLAAIALLTTNAQQLALKVGQTYGITAADQKKRVKEKYAPGQDTIFSALYWAWQRWKAEGMPYATFRESYIASAVAKDIAWRYEGADNIKNGFQNTMTFADWTDASAHWYMNRTAPLPRAGMVGISSFGFYDDTPVPNVFAACEFEMDDNDWWPANQTERHLFETPNAQLNGANYYSYNEAFLIRGIHLTGPAKYGDGYTRIGMFLRRPGECSKIDQVNAAMFQVGLLITGATPIDGGTVTTFWNELIGVSLAGSWGATVQFDVISGDSNGELLGVHPGYGEQSGGVIDVDLLKNEDAILAESATAPWRGQIAAYIEGQYSVNIGVVNCSRNGITTDAAFIVNPRTTDGAPQGSVLRVGPHKGYNYRTTLQNLATGKRWEAPANYQARTFTHYATGDRMIIDDLPVAGTPCNCPPLGFFRGNGTFDYNACTPVRAGTTPPPPGTWSCTAWSGWSTCVGNTQQHTRTCTCSGGCTAPKPSESETQACVPPLVMTLTVPCSSPLDGYGSGDASKAVDGNSSSYWLACKSMATGQEVVLALGGTRSVQSIAFTKPVWYANSYPREFTVWTSTTGAANSYTQRGGTFTNSGNASATLPAAVQAAYVKVVIGKTDPTWSGNYWGISEITVQ